jgi:hypothetical protein
VARYRRCLLRRSRRVLRAQTADVLDEVPRHSLLRITELGDGSHNTVVIPAKAGIQWRSHQRHWIPAFSGMTMFGNDDVLE